MRLDIKIIPCFLEISFMNLDHLLHVKYTVAKLPETFHHIQGYFKGYFSTSPSKSREKTERASPICSRLDCCSLFSQPYHTRTEKRKTEEAPSCLLLRLFSTYIVQYSTFLSLCVSGSYRFDRWWTYRMSFTRVQFDYA